MPDTPTPPIPILGLENIHFAHAGRPPICSGLCLNLHSGEQIGLFGPNGSGKTTLLRLIMGLEKPQKGRILLHGLPVADAKTLHRLRCSIGFVLQNSEDQLFSPTVLEDVAFGPLNIGLNRQEARDRAMETLESMGISSLADRQTHRLSGGEKKMVSIATVLSMRPEALFLDEPTSFLDDEAKNRIIATLQGQSTARIVVSHDRHFLEQTASTFLRIREGVLAPADM